MTFISLVLLFNGVVLVESLCNQINSNVVLIPQQRLTGYAFHRGTVNAVFSCARLCLFRSICESFNYNKETLECELNWFSHILSPDVSMSASMLYGAASDMPQSLVDNCEGHTCLCNQVCVPLDAEPLCMDIGGTTTPLIADSIEIVINTTYIEYTCKDGFTAEGNGTAQCNISSAGVHWVSNFTCNFINTTDCFILVNGIAVYSGTHGVNSDGDTCMNWADEYAVAKNHYDDATMLGLSIPNATLADSGNYCRDVQRNGNLYCPVKQGAAHVDEIECSIPPCL